MFLLCTKFDLDVALESKDKAMYSCVPCCFTLKKQITSITSFEDSKLTLKDETQTALFKDPVRTAQ